MTATQPTTATITNSPFIVFAAIAYAVSMHAHAKISPMHYKRINHPYCQELIKHNFAFALATRKLDNKNGRYSYEYLCEDCFKEVEEESFQTYAPYFKAYIEDLLAESASTPHTKR